MCGTRDELPPRRSSRTNPRPNQCPQRGAAAPKVRRAPKRRPEAAPPASSLPAPACGWRELLLEVDHRRGLLRNGGWEGVPAKAHMINHPKPPVLFKAPFSWSFFVALPLPFHVFPFTLHYSLPLVTLLFSLPTPVTFFASGFHVPQSLFPARMKRCPSISPRGGKTSQTRYHRFDQPIPHIYSKRAVQLNRGNINRAKPLKLSNFLFGALGSTVLFVSIVPRPCLWPRTSQPAPQPPVAGGGGRGT